MVEKMVGNKRYVLRTSLGSLVFCNVNLLGLEQTMHSKEHLLQYYLELQFIYTKDLLMLLK